MGKASSHKGAKGERDAVRLLEEHLQISGIERKLGAGRREDRGDIHGVPGFTIQVANRAALGQVLGDKVEETVAQQRNAGTRFGALLMKLPPRPGGKPARWRFVLTPEQFAEIYRALHE